MREPLGLLFGVEARDAVACGAGRWLVDGQTAYTMVRVDGVVRPVPADEPAWPSAPDWAGLGPGPLVMGILNVTPDSFSDGGVHGGTDAALAAGERMLADGASVIDVGGESTRPGADMVDAAEERARVVPVVAGLVRQGAVVSIDSRNAGTMAAALDAGARIVNDVSALRHDPASLPLVAARGCPVILMHMRGTPATMRGLGQYGDVAAEVMEELRDRVEAAVAGGVARSAIAVDPGFGFAKGAAQNMELVQRLPVLGQLGLPVVAGLSRKNTIGLLTGEREARLRDAGSVAAAVYAVGRGARIVRVHDVRGTVQALRVWAGLGRAA